MTMKLDEYGGQGTYVQTAMTWTSNDWVIHQGSDIMRGKKTSISQKYISNSYIHHSYTVPSAGILS
jgi:hypothetical protein